jgi:hypothetical protein
VKFFIYILVTFISIDSFSQGSAGSGKLSGEYGVFKTSGIKFLPPKDFQLSTHLDGYIHPGSGSSIIVTFSKGKNLTGISSSFNGSSLAKNNLRLVSQENVILKENMPGLLVVTQTTVISNDTVQQPMDFERILLFFETASGTVCINANFPANMHSLLFDVIKESLFSVEILTSIENE